MKLGKNRITDSVFITKILLLILVKPAYFAEFELISKMYKYIDTLLFCLLLIYTFFYKKKTFITNWILCFFLTILFTTFLESKNIYEYINYLIPNISLCLIFDIWLEKNPKVLIKASTILELYIIINFITIILYPKGMYMGDIYAENWFLGYKNPQIRTILPIICMITINSLMNYDKISFRTKLIIFISLITFVMIKSSTSLVGILVFLFLMFIQKRRNLKIIKLINIKSTLIVTSLIFTLISILKLQNIFSFIVVDLLKKDLTFHGRTQLWDLALVAITKKTTFGYGYLTGENFQIMFNSKFYTHPHNYILYILMTGGIVLLGVVIIGMLYANRKLTKNKNSKCSKTILFTIITFLIMGITESLTATVLLYPVLILGMHIDKIDKYSNVKEVEHGSCDNNNTNI